MKGNTPTIPEFTTKLENSPLWSSQSIRYLWGTLSPHQKLEYITWFYENRHQTYRQFLEDPGHRPDGSAPINDAFIELFGQFTKESFKSPEKGGSRCRRRSLPKSSRKYKKSKRVFRKKSRSTRRR